MSDPKEVEATAGWRKLYNDDLHTLNSSRNIVRLIGCDRLTLPLGILPPNASLVRRQTFRSSFLTLDINTRRSD